MANKPELSEVEFAAVIDLLRPLNPDEREPVILTLEHDYSGVGDRVRAALQAEENKVVKLRVEPRPANVIEPIEVIELGDGWRYERLASGSKWRVKGTDRRNIPWK